MDTTVHNSPAVLDKISQPLTLNKCDIVEGFLASCTVNEDSDLPVEVQQALQLAEELCRRSHQLQTSQERRQQGELDRMIRSPHDKATLMQLTDQAFRSQRPRRSADQMIHILDVQGIPRFFGAIDRTLLYGFQSFGSYLPSVAMPFAKERMRHETANVVLPAEPEHLHNHLRARWSEGVRMNINFLGEALLGEHEAEQRLHRYLAALQQPEIEVLSVKISTIYSQISPLARRHTIDILCDRLEILFRAAARNQFVRPDGSTVSKMVYLDMEEYRDKDITAEVFMKTLDRPGLEAARGGIALQAYLPDSFSTLERIAEWARKRVTQGGAPITVRIVKGANMEAECVEASLRGWPQAPYKVKLETDANYMRMLQCSLQAENIPALRIGIASHNLFTLTYGMVLALKAKCLPHVQFEMLEGIVNHQRRALHEFTSNILLYAPACHREDFTSAIGYLIRRMDENSGAGNFLRYAFHIEPASPDWKMLEQQFLDAYRHLSQVSSLPRRNQDRSLECPVPASKHSPQVTEAPYSCQTILGTRSLTEWELFGLRLHKQVPPVQNSSASPDTRPGTQPEIEKTCELNEDLKQIEAASFRNESDTDWSLPQNSIWAEQIVDAWKPRYGSQAELVPLVIGGEDWVQEGELRASLDPSRPGTTVAEYSAASEAHIERAITAACADLDHWRTRSMSERRTILHDVASEIVRRRGDLMGAMLAEGGKTLTESDPEISEAIDFCRFYADSAQEVTGMSGLDASGRGVVAVVSPWNFPLAIPCGGIAAALAAGNTVIFKPASETVLIAYHLCRCFWDAGVPKSALQFMPCSGSTVAQRLVVHERVDAVILTGGTSTAQKMLAAKPTMNLFAETGGKNATLVTALADRDQAIKNVLQSAFGHGGQKCSATSLLILESEVYHDRGFRATLCDAVESLRVGSAWDLSSKIGPLIHAPKGDLEQALKELEPGEEWAVTPRLKIDGNPNLVSPGIKWGVQPGSYTHITEFFGPVLGVMEARDLDSAIEMVNATGYGLTSGIESLDLREQRHWLKSIQAGNLYVNRPTTGAIVLRQPFGGMGKSAVGPGIKAGGPNYVIPLMKFTETHSIDEVTFDSESLAPHTSQPENSCCQTLWMALRNDLAQYDLLSSDELAKVTNAANSYAQWATSEFLIEHDHFRLLGEDNIRRYLPVMPLRIRVTADDTPREILLMALASRAVNCDATISFPTECEKSLCNGSDLPTAKLLDKIRGVCGADFKIVEETDEQLATAIREGRISRVRFAAADRVPTAVRAAAAEVLQYVADEPVSGHGRIELLWYLREQSVSNSYHRYGNLGQRANEVRDVPE
jgi:RHH-type proline utilization regulon transcriptional repressor/proline dehydrogenase/delta 1-pyrroline-5-carboxylate dehydrogenase